MTEKELYTLNHYGKIECTLREFLDSRHITRNKLARLVGTRFEVIDRWYKGDIEKLDTDVLARICFVLSCSPSDIIAYIPEESQNKPVL